MQKTYIVIREILHRKFNAALTVIAITFAVACLLGAISALKAFDIQAEKMNAQSEKELKRQMDEMEDKFRKITKGMGFNVLILPKDQNMSDFYAENYATTFMPESYADKLANAENIVTIRHLLPMLQMKANWPEQNRKVLAIGVRGEVAWAHRSAMSPLQKPVTPGSVVIGYELHNSLGLTEGEKIKFYDREFTIEKLHEERGSIDDITIWLDLKQAQEVFQKPDMINAMTALECSCAWADLPKIRKEIQAILPETQVMEFAGKAIARAETRMEASKKAKTLIENEKANRARLKQERQSLFAMLLPLVVLAAMIWIGGLAYSNVRQRKNEIGILRSLGLTSKDILFIFLAKASLLGLIGSIVGTAAAYVFVNLVVLPDTAVENVSALLSPAIIAAALLVTPVVSILSSWIPALLASVQDPAEVLRKE
jgi:ABC-type lipoprotein release transport system permease subunit